MHSEKTVTSVTLQSHKCGVRSRILYCRLASKPLGPGLDDFARLEPTELGVITERMPTGVEPAQPPHDDTDEDDREVSPRKQCEMWRGPPRLR